jgi:hypothetical protein
MNLASFDGLAPPGLTVQAGFVSVTFALSASLAPRMPNDDPEKTSEKTSGKILDAVRQNPPRHAERAMGAALSRHYQFVLWLKADAAAQPQAL